MTDASMLSIPSQLAELKQIKSGWLDGEGEAISLELMVLVQKKFASLYSMKAMPPAIFPSPDGGLCLEWSNEVFYSTLELRAKDLSGLYHELKYKDNTVVCKEFDILSDLDMLWLSKKISLLYK